MTNAADLTRLVPGFDFLQGLLKNTGASLPPMGQWIAPTLDPQELEKRIQELKTVQFWLEQNSKLLGTTIQALEVQRMTLATLKTMNLPLADLAESLKARLPMSAPAPAPAPEHAPAPARRSARKAAAPAPASPAIDPLQWWGALTQQFSELAGQAMKDSAADTAKNLAGAMVKGSLDTAAGALKTAASLPVKAIARATAKRKR